MQAECKANSFVQVASNKERGKEREKEAGEYKEGTGNGKETERTLESGEQKQKAEEKVTL